MLDKPYAPRIFQPQKSSMLLNIKQKSKMNSMAQKKAKMHGFKKVKVKQSVRPDNPGRLPSPQPAPQKLKPNTKIEKKQEDSLGSFGSDEFESDHSFSDKGGNEYPEGERLESEYF